MPVIFTAPIAVIITDDPVDETEQQREQYERRVPDSVVRHGGDTEVHEDDRLGCRRHHLHRVFDRRL